MKQVETGHKGAVARSVQGPGEPAAADALPTSSPYTLDQITGEWLTDRAGGEEAKRDP